VESDGAHQGHRIEPPPVGNAFLGIERDDSGEVLELWPLRPDRMRVLPDVRKYVRGFVYEHAGQRVAYLPEEVVWFKQYNPLEEFSGLSSVAPTRLTVDMGLEAQRFNRNFFANSATPGDLAITSDETPTDDEVAEFYGGGFHGSRDRRDRTGRYCWARGCMRSGWG